MDLKKIFSIIKQKGFHYFEGKTNDQENNLYISFTEHSLGKGNSIDLRIGNVDNDITYCFRNQLLKWNTVEHKNISDNDLFLFLEKEVKFNKSEKLHIINVKTGKNMNIEQLKTK